MSSTRSEHLVLTSNQTREPEILAAKIVNIKDLSSTVKGYGLKVVKGKTFLAGQWVDFFIPKMETVGGFSMCCPPSRQERNSILELAVKYSEWPPANWLHTKAAVGDNVSVRIGGDFYYPTTDTDKADHEVLLIAGGVGINPLASIYFHIDDLTADGTSKCKKVHLLFSAKTNDDHLFKQGLNRISDKYPDQFSVEYITTRDGNRRIDERKLQETLAIFRGPKKQLHCFLCGPPQMIKDMSKLLGSLGIPESNIKYELWW